jgi:hypothetical protein
MQSRRPTEREVDLVDRLHGIHYNSYEHREEVIERMKRRGDRLPACAVLGKEALAVCTGRALAVLGSPVQGNSPCHLRGRRDVAKFQFQDESGAPGQTVSVPRG